MLTSGDSGDTDGGTLAPTLERERVRNNERLWWAHVTYSFLITLHHRVNVLRGAIDKADAQLGD